MQFYLRMILCWLITYLSIRIIQNPLLFYLHRPLMDGTSSRSIQAHLLGFLPSSQIFIEGMDQGYLPALLNFMTEPNAILMPIQDLYCISMSMNANLIKRINSILPNLGNKAFKGDNGRIGVIGGSYQFTGAPFYSAISALKSGADLAHIFCSKSSSISIKSYSPQIIVHPVFVSEQETKYQKSQLPNVFEQWIQKIRSWEKAIHCWVIGPGLGRDPYMNAFFPELIKHIGKNKIVIFDADGIYYLAQYPQTFKHLKQCKTIITPNHKQLSFLKPYLNLQFNGDLQYQKNKEQIQQLPEKYRKLHEYSIIIKGQQDIILGTRSFVVRTPGGNKRCGGIGDILAGVVSACSYWDFELGPALGSRIVRKATHMAYMKQGRSMTAPCIIKQLPSAIRQIQGQYSY